MRLFRNYPVIIVVSCLLLAGCASSSGPIDPYVQKLQWLDAADPQADAQQAVKKQDYRLLGIAGRTVNIPGISKEELRGSLRRAADRGNFRRRAQQRTPAPDAKGT
jgi:hypothetical protein